MSSVTSELPSNIRDGLTCLVQRCADALKQARDAISDVDVDLETQAIYLQTDGDDKMDAKQLASKLVDPHHPCHHYLVIARAGSGKTWMMQQLTLALCLLYLKKESPFVPLLIPVQRLVGSLGNKAIRESLHEPNEVSLRTIVEKFLNAENAIPGATQLDFKHQKLFLELLSNRQLIVLIDGVDEASSSSDAVELFSRKWASLGIPIVVSSRPEGISQRQRGKVVEKHPDGSYKVGFDNGEDESNVPESRITNLSGKGRIIEVKNNSILFSISFTVEYDTGETETNVNAKRITNLSSKGKVSSKSWRTKYNITYDDGVKEENVPRERITPDSGAYELSRGDGVQVRDRPLTKGNRVQVQRPPIVGDEVEVMYEEGGRFNCIPNWNVLGLPELTLKQQKQLVDNVMSLTISSNDALQTFFDNLFKFSTSRQRYDQMALENFAEGEKIWLMTKGRDISMTRPSQVALDQSQVDEGLHRETLIAMYARTQDDIERLMRVGLDKKPASRQLQREEWMNPGSNFRKTFSDCGKRVFELFRIASAAN